MNTRTGISGLMGLALGLAANAALAASISLGAAGTAGVTAIIAPDPTEINVPTNVYFGAVWNGMLFMRNGRTWTQTWTGPLPVALPNMSLSASQTVPVVDFDIAGLTGLDVYVGYGGSEASLYLPGHLARIYTVPTPSSSIPYTLTVRDVSGNCTLYTTNFSGVLTPTGRAGIYETTFGGGAGARITLTVPGSNSLDFSYAEGGGTVNDHLQVTFDQAGRSISGSDTWVHTNGCYGNSEITGNW